MDRFAAHFGEGPDPRADNARYNLLEVIFKALATLLCGAESYTDMAESGQAKAPLLKQFLRLEHGMPSHDTFSRVFRLIDPERFEAAFSGFAAAFAGPLASAHARGGDRRQGAARRL